MGKGNKYCNIYLLQNKEQGIDKVIFLVTFAQGFEISSGIQRSHEEVRFTIIIIKFVANIFVI